MESTARTTRRPAIAQVVNDHPHRSELGALCLDVVRRQARGRSLLSGRKYVRARARQHGVLRKRAGTSAGHVLDILERGACEGSEAQLVMAFAVDALGHVLDAEDAGVQGIADEFVQLASWLSLATPYEPYADAEALLSRHARASLAAALVRSFSGEDVGSRASAMVRLEALAAIEGSHEGQRYLADLASSLDDTVLAAAAAALAGKRVSLRVPKASRAEAAAHCEGRVTSASGVSLPRVLGWLSGWALLRWIGRSARWAVGMRTTAGIWVDGPVVRCEQTTSLLGRRVHIIDESLRGEDVRVVVRELRHPAWVALLGAACLVAGFAGFAVSIDAALRSSSAGPLGWGLAALGTGAGLDLLLDFAARSRGAKVWIEIVASGRPALRLAGVDPAAAASVASAIQGPHTAAH